MIYEEDDEALGDELESSSSSHNLDNSISSNRSIGRHSNLSASSSVRSSLGGKLRPQYRPHQPRPAAAAASTGGARSQSLPQDDFRVLVRKLRELERQDSVYSGNSIK